MPKVSICVPIYQMDNAVYFLERNLYSIALQSFKDYEIVISDDSPNDDFRDWIALKNLPIKYLRNPGNHSMADNTNFAIDQAQGDLIKILYQDDYFYNERSLQSIVEHFTPHYEWLVTGCTHSIDGVNTFNDHRPYYSESENTIGSPSVLTFRREVMERFDPNFGWMLDLDFYKQLYRKYGKPKIYDAINVVIGIGMHQQTNKLADQFKAYEERLLKIKYSQNTYE